MITTRLTALTTNELLKGLLSLVGAGTRESRPLAGLTRWSRSLGLAKDGEREPRARLERVARESQTSLIMGSRTVSRRGVESVNSTPCGSSPQGCLEYNKYRFHGPPAGLSRWSRSLGLAEDGEREPRARLSELREHRKPRSPRAQEWFRQGHWIVRGRDGARPSRNTEYNVMNGKPPVSIRNSIKSMARRVLPQAFQHQLKKLYYPWLLRRFTGDEWPYTAAVSRRVNPGGVVMDIGANIGYVSLLLSRMVGAQGRVHSIEPVPRTFDLLSSNVRRLGLRNVVTHHYGVSAEDGTARMQIPDYTDGGTNYYEASIVDTDGAARHDAIEIQVRSLDSLCAELAIEPSFIKVDVEGHEQKVIEGARKLIQELHPVFLIEIDGDPDDTESNAGQMLSLMRGFGYECAILDGGAIRTRNPGERAGDYFFLPVA